MTMNEYTVSSKYLNPLIDFFYLDSSSSLITQKSAVFYNNNFVHRRSAVGCISAGVIFYLIAVRLRDIGFYAGLRAASPYPPVPISLLERFTMTISPVLDRAGIFCSVLCGIGLIIGVKNYF